VVRFGWQSRRKVEADSSRVCELETGTINRRRCDADASWEFRASVRFSCAVGSTVRLVRTIALIQLGGSWTNKVKTPCARQSITGVDSLAESNDPEPLLAPIPERAVASVYELRQFALYCGSSFSTGAGTAYESSCGDEEQRDLYHPRAR